MKAKELWIKEQRISYWEQFGIVPSMSELMVFNNANMEVKRMKGPEYDKLLLSDLYHWESDHDGNIMIKPNVHTAQV
jgi:hypothetical protein